MDMREEHAAADQRQHGDHLRLRAAGSGGLSLQVIRSAGLPRARLRRNPADADDRHDDRDRLVQLHLAVAELVEVGQGSRDRGRRRRTGRPRRGTAAWARPISDLLPIALGNIACTISEQAERQRHVSEDVVHHLGVVEVLVRLAGGERIQVVQGKDGVGGRAGDGRAVVVYQRPAKMGGDERSARTTPSRSSVYKTSERRWDGPRNNRHAARMTNPQEAMLAKNSCSSIWPWGMPARPAQTSA